MFNTFYITGHWRQERWFDITLVNRSEEDRNSRGNWQSNPNTNEIHPRHQESI